MSYSSSSHNQNNNYYYNNDQNTHSPSPALRHNQNPNNTSLYQNNASATSSSQHLNNSYNNGNNNNNNNNDYRNYQENTNNNNNNNGDRSASQDGLAGVAAQLEGIHPMFKAMRDLERRKQQEIHNLEGKLHQKDLEVMSLKRQVAKLQQENQALTQKVQNFSDHPLDDQQQHHHRHNSSRNMNIHHDPSSRMQKLQGLANSNSYVAATQLGSALSPKQTNMAPSHNNTLFAPAFFSDDASGTSSIIINNPDYSPRSKKNFTSSQTAREREIQQEKAQQEREELEDMLSRSISRLADAERALVSERTRFLVVDPGLISLERWREAVGRLADLHDEVAHRRFGACLAAARLSGQLPDDLPQMSASQYLRASLSPIVLQLLANCFAGNNGKTGSENKNQYDYGFDDVDDDRQNAATALPDPWRDQEKRLIEEPDILLHHVNCILERLILDPGDDFVQ